MFGETDINNPRSSKSKSVSSKYSTRHLLTGPYMKMYAVYTVIQHYPVALKMIDWRNRQ